MRRHGCGPAGAGTRPDDATKLFPQNSITLILRSQRPFWRGGPTRTRSSGGLWTPFILIRTRSRPVRAKWALGSSSHSYEEDFGSVHATVDNALGFAQALIHEMAHQKLRALGVSFETAERLIVNDPSEQFESPIRKDRTRPMTAVFHAQYSFIYVTALDLHMLAAAEGERERQCILMLLARNVPRMQVGYEEVARHIRTDAAGRLFVDAFMDWSAGVLQRGQAELDANGYG